jgi:sulfate/thiosulfate transport system substrate-binding protein
MMVKQQVSRSLIGLFIATGLSLALVACDNSNSVQSGAAQKQDVEITLVGYAVPKAAHNKIIKKLFSNKLMVVLVLKPVP